MALVHTHFYSNTIGRGISCDVIVPQKSTKQIGLDSAAGEKTKVLWLLHGKSDDHTIWQRRTSIERYVSPLGLAVVMPFVEISGYSNMAHGGRFFDYIAKELPEVMHGFFGFSLAREDNFICGLSMGGEGALKIGLANSDRYAAIGCLSAGLNGFLHPTDTSNIDYNENPYMFARFDGRQLHGSEEDSFNIARRIVAEGKSAPRIYHSTGDSDFLKPASDKTRDFFRSFDGNPFGYVYEEGHGAHTWEYWDEYIRHFLNFICE